jgi:hypothetical protein
MRAGLLNQARNLGVLARAGEQAGLLATLPALAAAWLPNARFVIVLATVCLSLTRQSAREG